VPAVETKSDAPESRPTVTLCVITPCFNPGRFLIPCLESVAAQGDLVSKHIVTDGGSTDGAVEVLERFGKLNPRLVWSSGADRGQADALNQALTHVHTAFFGWMNADDVYMTGGLAALMAAIPQGCAGETAIVYGDYQCIDQEGGILRSRRQPSFSRFDCLYGYLTVQNVAAIFNASITRHTSGFESSLRFAMDYDLVLRLAGQGAVVHTRAFVGQFRLHQAAKTSRMQDVCRAETLAIRLKHSRTPASRKRSFGTSSNPFCPNIASRPKTLKSFFNRSGSS